MMYISKLKATSLACLLLVATACASIVSESTYPVRTDSQPDQADITIVDEEGKTVYTGKTPTTVSLDAKESFFQGKDYKVTFTKEGYQTQIVSITRTVDGWYFGNILLGGLVGMLIVDPVTGAMSSLDDEVTTATLVEEPVSESENALRIVTIDSVPQALKSEMVRIR